MGKNIFGDSDDPGVVFSRVALPSAVAELSEQPNPSPLRGLAPAAAPPPPPGNGTGRLSLLVCAGRRRMTRLSVQRGDASATSSRRPSREGDGEVYRGLLPAEAVAWQNASFLAPACPRCSPGAAVARFPAWLMRAQPMSGRRFRLCTGPHLRSLY